MVIGYHMILSAYGFWLPNDPRGSWSDFVAAWNLYRVGGPATKVDTIRSVAHVPHDRALRQRTKAALKRPPVRFTGHQALAIAAGFGRAAVEGDYPVRACAILPDHCHLVVERTARPIERISMHLKAHATRVLRDRGLWTDAATPWARQHWGVFIDSPRWLRSAVAYVERNPPKEGLRPQHWRFVRPTTNPSVPSQT